MRNFLDGLLAGCIAALTITAAEDARASAIATLRSSAEAGNPQAIQKPLTNGWGKNNSVSLFKRPSPLGNLLMMKTGHGRLIIFLDFVNYTIPPDENMANTSPRKG